MTTAVKPIIKLPPRSNRSNSISVKPVEISIYFEDQENKLSDVDIQNLLQDFGPVHVAEKVYSFYNGYVFANHVIFKLSLNDSQQPEGPLLEIRNLPQSIDHHQLFELCRPFGSLHICKVIKEEGNIKKRALVQYFRKQDSDSSQLNLNNKAIEGSTIQHV
ncbi:hypothetical protein G6F45_013301 [Rhizopus arrhizus]|uniref:RRM domain-containing protein n=1 Tax=Rhizopus delemar TaxID=936053 RepID=A0A9P6YCN0_9FUNG|nr:hypothetical protein G6F53_013136 [Rhizopus delemar]KAG1544922.1 hypothetical protein G6F50_013811 [Rhizopus delemar]KAG1610252.1 hypothetical protein G6F45_013301 [Rhizopus arrhizus]